MSAADFTADDVDLVTELASAMGDLKLTYASAALMDLARRICVARGDAIGAARFPAPPVAKENGHA